MVRTGIRKWVKWIFMAKYVFNHFLEVIPKSGWLSWIVLSIPYQEMKMKLLSESPVKVQPLPNMMAEAWMASWMISRTGESQELGVAYLLTCCFQHKLGRRSREWCSQSIFRISCTTVKIIVAVRDPNQDTTQVYHELAHICGYGSIQFGRSNLGHVESARATRSETLACSISNGFLELAYGSDPIGLCLEHEFFSWFEVPGHREWQGKMQNISYWHFLLDSLRPILDMYIHCKLNIWTKIYILYSLYVY